ncbi:MULTISPECIES: RyR domain-containing protein [Bacteria]|uniref:RyR domain-containing protein n=1 Tax=Bacteria TaxID=2 RepID=UPI0036F7F498
MGIGPKEASGDVVPSDQGVVIGSPLPPFAPTHVSHKQVEAYPIAAAEFRSDGSGRIALKGGILIDVPAGFASRGAPTEGDMLVRYEPIPGQSDGYLSHSPRAVFEAGYAPIRGKDVASDAGPHFVTAAAWVCHEVNRAICATFGHDVQPDWIEAPDWQRDSAMKGVEFALANPDAPPSAQHEAWMADKLAQGWRYGEIKDADARTHPCLVAYDDLPADQRVKDHTFRAVVTAMRTLQVSHLVPGAEPTAFADLGSAA